MPRKTSSQWEFGELFEPVNPEPKREVLSVAELTTNVRKLLEKQIGSPWVSGEISNLRLQASGHAYFSLKDDKAQLNCVLFRGQKVSGREALDNGLQVILNGDLTVYEPRGQYQLIVRELEFQGAGALQVAFEKLKKKLDAAGYFAPERKRPLPDYPERIGVVTSATGAALRDVLHVIERRYPSLQIVLAPCRVQGQGAAEEIADRIHHLNEWSAGQVEGEGLDLILTTRGGGSLEDLWAFNEEVVASAIYRSDLPVVSAVGHEIDFTISDFVADVRAATPSAAAEIITEGVYGSIEFVHAANDMMVAIARRAAAGFASDYNHLLHRLNRSRPLRKVQDQMQRLDELLESIQRAIRTDVREANQQFVFAARSLQSIKPAEHVQRLSESVGEQRRQLNRLIVQRLNEKRARLDHVHTALSVLSPEKTIERGYSITTDAKSGELIRDHRKVKPGQKIVTRVKTGEFNSSAE